MTGRLKNLFSPRRQDSRVITLTLQGLDVPVLIKKHQTARRMILRLDTDHKGVKVTLPRGVREAEALAFVRSKEQWILNRLKKVADKQPFDDGVTFPFQGIDITIQATGRSRGGMVLDGQTLRASGSPAHLNRRITDWLKAEARQRITHLIAQKTGAANLKAGKLTIRDTKSRWGSCAVNGNLNFSWRLIMAPPFVLDYVVAHEVAHLAHHNHGPQFWALVDQLTDHTEQGKAWLKAFGNDLYLFG